MPSPAKPLALREAFKIYKEGGFLGRQDMIGLIIDEVEKLQARIGAVDEAAVADLDKRVGSLETVIGNALRAAGSYEPINADGAAPKQAAKPRAKQGAA